MAQIALEARKTRPTLAIIAVAVALGAPLIQVAMRPLLENNFPDAVARFLSLWIFWIAIAFALFVSVRIEGIPLATFGITKNKRSLRYRLIEMIAALLTGLVVTIVLVSFSQAVRSALNIPAVQPFDPASLPPAWVLIPAWFTAGFAEEFLFRAYPIERLTLLTGNRWFAAGISMLAFAVFHIFGWDWVHVLTLVLPGSILITGLYMWRKSLWFVVVVHALIDIPLLLLPLLAPYL
jgi:membrane protease YdiL (CAAX protease family)